MSAQVIQIGRRRFVGGLFWQSLSRRNELRAEAVELAKKLKFDLMVLRIDRGVAAAGYANTRDGFAPGHLSLGAMVSRAIALEGAFYNGRRQPAPNWLGAFALPDGRWAYFAVRDHAFMPNGDWVGSREEALERLHTDYAWGGWNVVIGEPELERQGFQNFQPKRLDDLLPRRGGRPRTERWWALRPVERRLSPRAALIAATAACVVLGGAFAYWHHRAKVEAEEREAALERVRAELAARQARSGPVAPPWAALPDALAFARVRDALRAARAGRLAARTLRVHAGHRALRVGAQRLERALPARGGTRRDARYRRRARDARRAAHRADGERYAARRRFGCQDTTSRASPMARRGR